MIEAVKDLAVSYPFIPGSTVPEALKHIKDARIVFELPANTYRQSGSNTLQFYAELVSISPTKAVFHVVCTPFGVDANVTVPVNVGIFNVPMGNSYVLVDEPVTYTGSHMLHPDCLIFLQKAPKLSVADRTNVRSDDSYSSEVYGFGPTIAFADGYNVSVSGNESMVVFNGGEGSGLGIWLTSPWIDVKDSTLRAAVGLRTINGKNGDVQINGSSSVGIEGTGGIELVINPLPYPEDDEEAEVTP